MTGELCLLKKALKKTASPDSPFSLSATRMQQLVETCVGLSDLDPVSSRQISPVIFSTSDAGGRSKVYSFQLCIMGQALEKELNKARRYSSTIRKLSYWKRIGKSSPALPEIL